MFQFANNKVDSKKNDFIRNFHLSTVRFNLNEESSIQAFFSSDAI